MRSSESALSLGSGDFLLKSANGRTYLTALSPTPAAKQQVRLEGDFSKWSTNRWRALLAKAEGFRRPDLERDLRGLMDEVLNERASEESPVVDGDRDGRRLQKVHTLELHYSREKNRIEVRGTATYEHRSKLRELGLRWNPSAKAWESGFSEKILRSAEEYVAENDTAYDPGVIGYERCPSCGRWKPKELQCSCRP